jgi:hypothetical protein
MWHILGRGEMCIGLWWGNLRERDHLEALGIDGRRMLKWVFKKLERTGMDWIDLVEDWDRSQAFVNVVMNL